MSQTFSGTQHLASSAVAGTGTPLTLMMWFTTSGGQFRRFLSLVQAGSNSNLFGLCTDSTSTSNKLAASIASSTPASGQLLGAVVDVTGNWNHGTVIFTSGSLATYLNGANKTSGAGAGFSPSSIGQTIISGRASDFSAGVTGQGAHAAVWTRALSDAEVAYLGAGGNPRAIKGCVSYWKIASGESPVVDQIGANNLTATGPPAAGTTNPNLQTFLTGSPVGALSYTQGTAITAINLAAGAGYFDDVSSAFTVTLQQLTATGTSTATSSALTAVREVPVASVTGFAAGDYVKIAAAAVTRVLGINTTAVTILVADDQTYSTSATVTRYSASPLTVAGCSITSNSFSGTPSAAVTNNNCFFRATCNATGTLMADTDVFTMTIASGGGGGSGGLLLFGDDMGYSRFNGAQSECPRIWLPDSSSTTGAGKTGLTGSSTGLIISTLADGEATPTVYTAAGSTIDTIATIGTYVAPTSGHCRFAQVDATNHPGLYEMQFSNARFAVANAKYLDIAVQAAGSNVPPRNLRYDLDAQVDTRAYGGTAGTFASGVPTVNMGLIGGVASRVTKLGLEMDGRVIGTVTTASFSPTTTQAEFSDITTAASFSVFINRGFLITSGAMQNMGGVILGDFVGTAGRRITFSALPQAFANGDTIVIM